MHSKSLGGKLTWEQYLLLLNMWYENFRAPPRRVRVVSSSRNRAFHVRGARVCVLQPVAAGPVAAKAAAVLPGGWVNPTIQYHIDEQRPPLTVRVDLSVDAVQLGLFKGLPKTSALCCGCCVKTSFRSVLLAMKDWTAAVDPLGDVVVSHLRYGLKRFFTGHMDSYVTVQASLLHLHCARVMFVLVVVECFDAGHTQAIADVAVQAHALPVRRDHARSRPQVERGVLLTCRWFVMYGNRCRKLRCPLWIPPKCCRRSRLRKQRMPRSSSLGRIRQ